MNPDDLDAIAKLYTGFSIKVSKNLEGSKKAVRQGSTIYVSPAMYDLMKHANEVELRQLL